MTDPDGVFRERIILQGRQLTSGLPVIGKSLLIKKGCLIGAFFHAPIQSNSRT